MVMVWLEGGQGEVRGACAPPHHHYHPESPHFDPPPTSRPPPPPPRSSPYPPSNSFPPGWAFGPLLLWGGGCVQKRGDAPPLRSAHLWPPDKVGVT